MNSLNQLIAQALPAPSVVYVFSYPFFKEQKRRPDGYCVEQWNIVLN